MKCKNCGTELQEGAVFCQGCGSKVEAAAENTAEAKTENVAEKTEETKAPEAAAAAQAQPQPEAQATEAQPQAAEAQAQSAQPQAAPAGSDAPKKNKALPIIIGVAAVAVLAIVIALCVKLFSGAGRSRDVSTMAVFLEKDTLCYTPDATAKEPKIYEICDIDIDDSFYYIPDSLVTITDDEKYIYFFNDVSYDGYGDLCRIQISKIGSNKEKNESKVEELDDKISLYTFTILDGGKFAYVTGKDKLFIYNGKESVEIQKDVEAPYTVDGGKALVYLGDEDSNGRYSLFYLDITKTEAEEIEDGVSYISSVEDDGVYYCVTDEETWESALYVYSFSDAKTTEICEDYSYSSIKSDKGFYYIEHVDTELCIYDFINDPYARDDENITEPVYPDTSDGFVPVNVSDVFDEYRLERIDEYYDGDPVAYIEDNCWTYNYGDVEYYSIYNGDTDEYYYYDAAGDKYYAYNDDVYEQAYEDYQTARELWNSAQNRISLRQALKDYTFNPGYVSINYYHDGKSEEVVSECTDVMFANNFKGEPVALYHLPNTDDIDKISIDDISWAYDAYDRLFGYDVENETEVYYAVGADADHDLGLEGEIDDIAYSDEEGLCAVAVYTTDKNGNSQREVFLYNVKGTDFALNDKFDDEADCIAAFNSGKVFFIKGMDGDGMEGDLYVYDGKNSTKIIKNVNVYYYGALFANGNILAYDDSDAILYNKNGEEIIKLGPINTLYTDMNYISDKKIVYLSEGKLKVYNGKEIVKIASNVGAVWFSRTGSYTTMTYRY